VQDAWWAVCDAVHALLLLLVAFFKVTGWLLLWHLPPVWWRAGARHLPLPTLQRMQVGCTYCGTGVCICVQACLRLSAASKDRYSVCYLACDCVPFSNAYHCPFCNVCTWGCLSCYAGWGWRRWHCSVLWCVGQTCLSCWHARGTCVKACIVCCLAV
jgi:hypothetical protein